MNASLAEAGFTLEFTAIKNCPWSLHVSLNGWIDGNNGGPALY